MNRFLSWILTLTVVALLASSCSSSNGATAGTSTVSCGQRGIACCAGDVCAAGLACESATCVAIGGGEGGASGDTSASPAPGASGGEGGGGEGGASGATSESCGALGSVCCSDQTCTGALSCRSGSCQNAPSNGTGTPCAKNSDCPSGICLPTGGGNVCTTTCGSVGDCIAGWTCGALLGQSSNICQCKYSAEVCDGLDNDCDGIVDDDAEANQGCEATTPGYVCTTGSCACKTTCGGTTCVDTLIGSRGPDPKAPSNTITDCGSCGTTCPTGATCQSGTCKCPTGDSVSNGECCPTGQNACDSACVNEQMDPSNCGGCGTKCDAAETCQQGSCACPVSGTSFCGSACVNEQTDASNCGSCNTICPTAAPACIAGVCRSSASCIGLAATCGPSGNASCCASSVVTGGTFNRGNDANYPATVSDFRLDTYEITVGRFKKFWNAYPGNMPAAGSGKNPNNASDPGWDGAWNTSALPASQAALTTNISCDANYQTWTAGKDNLPMNCIDWYEAEAFCIWDGGRLPTEAEWNYAAAGGTAQRVYPWGSTVPGANANLAVYGCYYPSGSGSCTGVSNIAPVGSIPAGNGLYGQADLAGNVWEWVQDWYASPYTNPCNNCSYVTVSSYRVLRGGSFLNLASDLLSSVRSYGTPSDPFNVYGGRCARTR